MDNSFEIVYEGDPAPDQIPIEDQAEYLLTRDLYASLVKFLGSHTEEPWDFMVDYKKAGEGNFICYRHEIEISYAEWTKLSGGNILTGVPQLLKAVKRKHLVDMLDGRTPWSM